VFSTLCRNYHDSGNFDFSLVPAVCVIAFCDKTKWWGDTEVCGFAVRNIRKPHCPGNYHPCALMHFDKGQSENYTTLLEMDAESSFGDFIGWLQTLEYGVISGCL
jgi:hypothetical protein